MNKLFTKITSLALGAAMMIGVGVAVGSKSNVGKAEAAQYTGEFTSSNKITADSSNYSLGGLTWTVSHTKGTYQNMDSSSPSRGQQFGSVNTPMQAFSMKTNSSISNVTSVVVNGAIAKSGTAKLSIKVGSTSYLSNQSLATTSDDYEGTGSSSGQVEISVSNTSKAFYIKSFTITYGQAQTYTVTYKAGDGSGNDHSVSGITSGSNHVLLDYDNEDLNYTAPQYCTFSGWSVVIGTATAVTKTAGQSISVTANAVCTAIWTDSRTTVTLTASAGKDNLDINEVTDITVNSSVSGLSYTYSTSDATIATVSDAGKIKGIAVGSATITVAYAGSATYKPASTTVGVTVYDSSVIEIDFVSKYGTTTTDIVGVDQIIDSNFSTKVVFSKGQGTNDPKYYTDNTAANRGVRCYAKNTFTVSSTRYLKTITLTFAGGEGSNTITTNVNTYTEPTWSAGSATDINSVTFTIGGSSGNRRIRKINVEYVVQGATVVVTSTFNYLKAVGDTGTVMATIVDPVGTEGAISFASETTSVATINETTGVVEAKGVGTTKITVSATGATEASFTLRVISTHSGATQNDALTSSEALAFGEYLNETDLALNYYTGGEIYSISNTVYNIDNSVIDLKDPTFAEGITSAMLVEGRSIIFYGQIEPDSASYYWHGEVVYVQLPELNSISFGDSCDMTYKTYSSKGSYWKTAGLVVNANYSGESPVEVTDDVEWSFSVGAPSALDFTSQQDITNYSLTVTASYGGKSASKTVTGITVTFDGYEIHTFDGGWTKVTDASSLSAGDQIVIGSAAQGRTAGAISSAYLTSLESNFGTDEISTLNTASVVFTLGGSAGAWTLSNPEGEALGTSAAKSLAWNTGTTTWNISISDGSASITSYSNGEASGYGRILYNVNSPRFLNYTSSPSASMLLPEIYRKTGVYDVKDDLINAINGYYSTDSQQSESKFVCDSDGVNFDVTHWNNSSALEALKTKYELNKIVANPEGNLVEKFLAMYDYVIGTKKISLQIAAYASANDYLDRYKSGGIHGSQVFVQTSNAFAIQGDSTSIIIIISVIGVSALGGFFFLRKRKEI